MKPTKRIALVVPEESSSGELRAQLEENNYEVVELKRPDSVLGLIYSDPPDMLIIGLEGGGDGTNDGSRDIIQRLKKDCNFSLIPIIATLPNGKGGDFNWEEYPVDDFLTEPIDYPTLLSRLRLSEERTKRVFDNNPLSKLPGNTSVQLAIEEAIGTETAVCYLDINNFKPYNDKYGFSSGDEVLRMVARILTNTVKDSPGGGFVGHIGGDDYVFTVPKSRAEEVCDRVIRNFDLIVTDLFDDEAKEKHHYYSTNRQGLRQKFPLMSISIGVVLADNPKYEHYGQISEVAAELKKVAKKASGSACAVDKRNL